AIALALECQDAEQIIEGIAYVRTGIGARTLRHPPEAQQRHDVIDAQRAAVTHVRAQELDEIRIDSGPQDVRVDCRQAPILALQGESVGWRADTGLCAIERLRR